MSELRVRGSESAGRGQIPLIPWPWHHVDTRKRGRDGSSTHTALDGALTLTPVTLRVSQPRRETKNIVLSCETVQWPCLPLPLSQTWMPLPHSLPAVVGAQAEDCVPDLLSSRKVQDATERNAREAMELVQEMQNARRERYAAKHGNRLMHARTLQQRHAMISVNRARVVVGSVAPPPGWDAAVATLEHACSDALPPSPPSQPDMHGERFRTMASRWCRRCFQFACIKHNIPLENASEAREAAIKAEDGEQLEDRRMWPKPSPYAHVERSLERMQRLQTLVTPTVETVVLGPGRVSAAAPKTSAVSSPPMQTTASASGCLPPFNAWLAKRCWAVAAAPIVYPIIASVHMLPEVPSQYMGMFATLPILQQVSLLHAALLSLSADMPAGADESVCADTPSPYACDTDASLRRAAYSAAHVASELYMRACCTCSGGAAAHAAGRARARAHMQDAHVTEMHSRVTLALRLLRHVCVNVPVGALSSSGVLTVLLPHVRTTMGKTAGLPPIIPQEDIAMEVVERDQGSTKLEGPARWRMLSGYPLTSLAPSRTLLTDVTSAHDEPALERAADGQVVVTVTSTTYRRRVGDQLDAACAHDGPCDAHNCMCVALGVACERFCACASSCEHKFLGCTCAVPVGRSKGARSRGRAPRGPRDAPRQEEEEDGSTSPALTEASGALKTSPVAGPPPVPAASSRGTCCSSDEECPCRRALAECDVDVCVCGYNTGAPLQERGHDYGAALTARGCVNAASQRGQHLRLALTRSTTHGWGACVVGPPIGQALPPSTQPWSIARPSDFVYTYCGERISQSEADDRGVLYDAQHMSYLFNLGPSTALAVADAVRFGNKSKYANHRAEGTGGDNLEVVVVDVAGQPRILFRAKRALTLGDECCFDYNYDSQHQHAIRRGVAE